MPDAPWRRIAGLRVVVSWPETEYAPPPAVAGLRARVAGITGVLLIVAGTFIVFSLVVSMVVPRRYPGFPGNRIRLFIAVCALLFVAQIGAVFWVKTVKDELHPAPPPPPREIVLPAGVGPAEPGEPVPAMAGSRLAADDDGEPDPELDEYNAYLAELAKADN